MPLACRRLLRGAALAACLCLGTTAAAHASPTQEAQFQDDNHLIYAPPDQVAKTLDTLQGLGVDRLRVSIIWKAIAPDPGSRTRPAGFAATDPAAYPAGAFDHYDFLVRQAQARGMSVNFDVTAPAPLWATGQSPDRPDVDATYDPDPAAFADFVTALGTRYSGTYQPAGQATPLPRVSYWSIWNEPNQGAWLDPQYAIDPRNPKQFVEASPQIYRTLLDAAFGALQATGHGQDTILAGETAPKGAASVGETKAMAALRFVRNLYCVDDNLQFLQGTSAQLRGCPVSDQAATFVAQHPGLFKYTGYAHHPYELTFSPSTKPTLPDSVTIANLPTLETLLRRIFERYGQPMPGGGKRVPLYLTEFGYQTDPPDKFGVSPAEQAAYINQSEFIAYEDPSVRTLSQFLLYDDGGDVLNSFQSGLFFIGGKKKPAFNAYAMPIYIAHPTVHKGAKVSVWGADRLAAPGRRAAVAVQARPAGAKAFTTLTTAHTVGTRGYLTAKVALRRSSAVRLRWVSPGGTAHVSRTVAVTVR